MLPIKSFTFP